MDRRAQAGRERDDQRLPVSPALGCMLSVLLGLVGVGLVFLVGSLVVQGELVLGRGELTETRLWLVREETNQGLAFSMGRAVDAGPDRETTCVKTRAWFLLWHAQQPTSSVAYCECYKRQAGQWRYQGLCEP